MAQSSDEDEFASNFDATTTPFRAVKVTTATKQTKTRSNARNVAGPSKPPSRGKRKRSPTPQEDDDEEVEEIVVHNADNQNARSSRSVRGGKAPTSGQSHQRQTSGSSKPKTAQRGRGKVEAEHGPRTEDVMDVDDIAEGRTEPETEHERDDRKPAQPRVAATRQEGRGRQNIDSTRAEVVKNHKEERAQRQIDQLRKQLEQVTSTRNSLAQQLEEVFRTRTTEAEEILEQQSTQYEARLKTQEEMIQELTSQLARVDSLTREGKTSTLHFLTREAADEERRGLETELAHVRAALRAKEKELEERDAQIKEREDTMQTLRSDLRAEIDNTKAIMSRTINREPPSSATKNKPNVLPKQDPKHGLIVRLYEDLTNFLVMNIKVEAGKVSGNTKGPDEMVYKCVYTAEGGRSLTFDLRYYTGVNDEGGSTENVLYTPMQLENEPDQEFVESLGMLADSFTFNRVQMDEFFKQLRLIVGGEGADDAEEEQNS